MTFACSDIEEALALHKNTMALANGVIHMISSPLSVEGVEEGAGNSALAPCLPAFILQQYSNQCLHHLVPLATGEPLLYFSCEPILHAENNKICTSLILVTFSKLMNCSFSSCSSDCCEERNSSFLQGRHQARRGQSHVFRPSHPPTVQL